MIAGRNRNTPAWGWSDNYADAVADAVADAYPDRALAIYQKRLAELLTHADRSAYQEAGALLQKIRPLLIASQRDSEWTDLIARLRTASPPPSVPRSARRARAKNGEGWRPLTPLPYNIRKHIVTWSINDEAVRRRRFLICLLIHFRSRR